MNGEGPWRELLESVDDRGAHFRHALWALGFDVVPRDDNTDWAVKPSGELSAYLTMSHGMTLTDWMTEYGRRADCLHRAVDWIIHEHQRHNPWEQL